MFNNFMGGFPQQPQQPNFNNGYGYGYGGIFNGAQPQQPSAMKTNIVLVTGLEDARSRYAEPNSNMIYFDQDKSIAYNVMTDMQGRKTYKILDLSEHKESAPAPTAEYVTKADVEEIVKKQLEALTKKEDIE